MVSSSPFMLNDELHKASRGTAMQHSLTKRIPVGPDAAPLPKCCAASFYLGRVFVFPTCHILPPQLRHHHLHFLKSYQKLKRAQAAHGKSSQQVALSTRR